MCGAELACTIIMNEQFYSSVVDHQSTAILIVNALCEVDYMNSAAEAIFNVSRKRVIGMSLNDLLVDESSNMIPRIQQTLESEQSWMEYERTFRVLGEKQITIDCMINPINFEGENKVLLEIQHLDRQLKISKENHLRKEHEATRSMLRGMAHEIKNPLGGLRGAAQLLQDELDSEELTEYTQIIIKEADRLHKLVDRMLGPNMLPNKVLHNIHEVLQHVHSLVSAESKEGIRLNIDYDPSIPLINFDRDFLVQAVLNITRNAVKAVEQNGTITFKTRILRHNTVAEKFYKLVACISIIDDGPGIPEEIISQIFFPMVSGQNDGTGLGLAISQLLINQHDGAIEFDSEPGRTVFRILLPIEADDNQETNITTRDA